VNSEKAPFAKITSNKIYNMIFHPYNIREFTNQFIGHLMKQSILVLSFLATVISNISAQNIPGFPREDFG
jgi:hypothetical protein